MDVEILLHGVPSGQDYYGIKEEQKLAESFYTSSNESVKLVVEAKKNGTTPYVYYTYLRYKNIVGAGGRSGSYIGITLRLDMYYLDVVHMYNMLDMAFKKYIIGALLTPTGESYKYVSPDFTSKKLEIEQLQQGVLKLIETTCVFPKFVKIDNSFINQITNAPTCNIADITEGTMSATIKKYSKIILSPDYKSNLEKEYEKKVQDAEGRGGSIVAEKEKKLLEKDTTIAQKDTTITNLNTTISSRDTEIATLKQEIKRKDQELAQNKQKGEISQLINKVREPIIALSEYFHVKDSELRKPTPKFGKKNFYLGIANTALSVIIVVMLVISLLLPIISGDTSKDSNKLKSQYETLFSKYSKLEAEYNSLNNQYQSLLNHNSNNNIQEEQNAKKKTEAEAKKKAETGAKKKANEVAKRNSETPVSIQLRIAMEPNVNEIEIGKEYTFTVQGYTGEGEWKVDGFTQPEHKSAISVKVKAIDTGKDAKEATISYTPKGREDAKKIKQIKYKTNE